jgi:diguanylate cyclase (GGDEF)-like protein
MQAAADQPQAGRRPWIDIRARWRAGAIALGLAALLTCVAALRPLAPPGTSLAGWTVGPRLRLLYVVALGLGVAGTALLSALKGRGMRTQLAFYAFLVLSIDGLGQIGAPYGWQAWPLTAILVAALAVAEPIGIALGVAALATLMAVAETAVHDFAHWPAAASAALGYTAIALGVDRALAGEKRRLAESQAELARVTFGVEQLAGGSAPPRPTPASRALGKLSGDGRRARRADHALELDEAMQSIVQVARLATRAHAVCYFDLDREREVAHLRAADGPPTLERNAAIPFTQDPVAFVIDRRQSFYATDFKRLLWNLPYYKGEVRVGTLLALPVRVGGVVAGVLVADKLEIQALAGAEAELLPAFAEMAAGTLQRLRAAFSREEQGLEFSAVYEAAPGLRDPASPARVRQNLLASAQNLVAVEAAAVVGTDGERYTIEAAVGWALGFEGREVALDERTWAAWVVRSAPRSMLVSDLAREKDRMPALVLDEGAGRAESLMAFPLRVSLTEREERVGAFLVLGRRGAFDAGAQRVLEMLADQAALSLFAAKLIRSHLQRALEDGLTGLYNRRAFNDQFARQIAQEDRRQGRLAVLLFDLDHFKKLNDTYGHPAGDAALRSAARTIRREARRGDVAARYGGEEFVVILPGTDEAGARELAERMRRGIEQAPLVFEGATIRFTASFGLAVWPADGGEETTLLAAADRALYAAKQAGRNRVVAASTLPPAEPLAEAASPAITGGSTAGR